MTTLDRALRRVDDQNVAILRELKQLQELYEATPSVDAATARAALSLALDAIRCATAAVHLARDAYYGTTPPTTAATIERLDS